MSRILAYLLALLPLSSFAADVTVRALGSDGAPLEDAVVYALPVKAALPSPGRKPAAEVQQLGNQFVPRVTVVERGTPVRFPNRDRGLHDVYSSSPAKIFYLRLYSGTAPGVLFDKPGVVTLGCNIHAWMLGYVVVVETPYFAKSTSGAARLSGLPAGEYHLKVWHPRLKGDAVSQRVSVAPKDATSLEVRLELVPEQKRSEREPSAHHG